VLLPGELLLCAIKVLEQHLLQLPLEAAARGILPAILLPRQGLQWEALSNLKQPAVLLEVSLLLLPVYGRLHAVQTPVVLQHLSLCLEIRVPVQHCMAALQEGPVRQGRLTV